MTGRLAAWGYAAAIAASSAFAQLPGVDTLPDADWRAIRSVVESQRAALVEGDAVRAFAFASPGIRQQFGDPPSFLAMVRRAYPALLDARDATPLEGAVIDGDVIQPLRLVMPDDTVLIALYRMARERGGTWKISGCVIAPSTLKAT